MAETHALNLVLRDPGTPFRSGETNRWGSLMNGDLMVIDEVIGQVCGELQINEIRHRLQGRLKFFTKA